MPKVYAAISAVQKDLSSEGIAKGRRNSQGGGYNFRGIDDVYNALSPLMAKHGLCVLPRILKREITERASKAGGTLFYVVVEAEFDFVAAEDGSVHVVRTFGEAMDSGDKATNKAMSAAYKYAAFMAFAIPTEANDDADAHTHEVAPQRTQAPKAAPAADPMLADVVKLARAVKSPDVTDMEYARRQAEAITDSSTKGMMMLTGLRELILREELGTEYAPSSEDAAKCLAALDAKVSA